MTVKIDNTEVCCFYSNLLSQTFSVFDSNFKKNCKTATVINKLADE